MDNKFMEKFMEIGGRIGGNKYMTALRDCFAYAMPLIMAGAIAVMLNNVFFNDGSVLSNLIGSADESAIINFTSTYLSPWFGALDIGTLSMLSLAVVAGIAYIRAEQENVDKITTVMVTMGSFFILQPITRVSDVSEWITSYFGSMGLFVALFVGLAASEIFIRITKKGWTIKMPEMVPPAVGKGFAAIIPGAVTFLIIAIIPWLFSTGILHPTQEMMVDGVLTETPITNIFQWVEHIIMTPLIDMYSNADESGFFLALSGAVFIDFLKQLFWFFGLHGANMIAPVINSVFLGFDTANASAFAAGASPDELIKWTSVSWTIYVNHGGSGATLGLLIAMKYLNKRPDSAAIANLSMGPGFFQINEPVIFGIPMVLNPIYAIPFVFVSPILTAVSFISVYAGFGAAPVNPIPWTTPPVLGALIATNFDWQSAVLALATLALSAVLYAPFVLLANKEYEKQADAE